MIVQPIEPLRVPLAEAYGRWLREDLIAPEDLPHFDRSAMDGFAVAADDRSDRFRVVGECQAGIAQTLSIRHGECVRIFTGAALPAGATQVLIQEEVQREGDWIVPRARSARLHVRHRGEDARRGDSLIPAGTRLTAGGCALLAHVGIVAPLVAPRLRVVHIATGDELIDPAAIPQEGEIRDSNSTLVAGLLAQHPIELVRQARCKDSLPSLTACLEANGAEEIDLFLVSGGASVGDYDFGAKALAEVGFTIHFNALNLRPGKPTIFATRARQLAFVIPGNPLAHFVVFHLLIAHALRRRSGVADAWPLARVKRGGMLALESDRRETYWPARIRIEGGALVVEPLRWRSSGDMSSLPFANALIRVPAGKDLAAGDLVDALLLDSFATNSDGVIHE